MLVCSFLLFPSAGAQLAAQDNIVGAAERRHFTDSVVGGWGCDWVGVARCMRLSVLSEFDGLPSSCLCDSREMFQPMNVREEGLGAFHDVAFCHYILVTSLDFRFPFLVAKATH